MVIVGDRSVNVVMAAGVAGRAAAKLRWAMERADHDGNRRGVGRLVDSPPQVNPAIDIVLADERQDLHDPAMVVSMRQIEDRPFVIDHAWWEHRVRRRVISHADTELQEVVGALRLAAPSRAADWIAGSKSAIKIAMIATTNKSSINVKAERRFMGVPRARQNWSELTSSPPARVASSLRIPTLSEFFKNRTEPSPSVKLRPRDAGC